MSASETTTTESAGFALGRKAARSGVAWAVVAIVFAAAFAWWQYGSDEQPSAGTTTAEAVPAQLTDRQRYDMMMVDPGRARTIREAADRKALVAQMRDIEKAAATAIAAQDAKEFKIQMTYADLAMARMAQIPESKGGRDADCVSAAIDLSGMLNDVARSFSPARAEQTLRSDATRWRKSMSACERAVGLKPSSRAF